MVQTLKNVQASSFQTQPEIRRRRSTCVDVSTRVDLERKRITVLRLKKAYIDACSHISTQIYSYLFHLIEQYYYCRRYCSTGIDSHRRTSTQKDPQRTRATDNEPERQTANHSDGQRTRATDSEPERRTLRQRERR